MSRWTFPILLGVAGCLAGCTNSTEVAQTKLVNSTWQLVSVEFGGLPTPVPTNQVFTIHFASDSTAYGQDLCNFYNATYSLGESNSIVFRSFGSTEVDCPSSIGTEFRLAFDKADILLASDQELQILYFNRTRALRFIRVQ